MADARIVANRFLELASDRSESLTPMQVLKLVYIAHGWMLGLTNTNLIDQRVQAWQYGPVIPELYNAMRHYRGDAVTSALSTPLGAEPLTAPQDDMIRQVFELYGRMTGFQLSNITHMAETPWADTYRPGAFGRVIGNDVIAAHYRRLNEQRNGTG